MAITAFIATSYLSSNNNTMTTIAMTALIYRFTINTMTFNCNVFRSS